MDVRKLVLLVGALLIAGITAFVARNIVSGQGAPSAGAIPLVSEPQGPEVLVATKPLPAGTIIDAATLKFQPWPKSMVDNAYYLKAGTDPATLNGKVVRYMIAAGQPLTQGSLVGPGEKGFLAAALTPGTRALTVAVSDLSGVAGFVFPGDRVDLMLTQEVTGDGAPLKVTETVVRNVRVLAVDQTSANVTNQPQVGRTITLEATPKIAEKIAVSQTLGSLSLSLRSITDSAAELERAIAAGEVEVADNQDAAADKAMELALATLPSDANPTFTTGGEVSRFQRSSAPPRPMSAAQAAAAAASPTVRGPVVRVARGNAVTDVPLGAN